MPAMIKSYRDRYPDVKLDFSVMNNVNLKRALVEREIDIAVARPTLEDPEFRKELLFTEPLALALPEGSDLCSRADISIADLAGETIVLSSHQARPGYSATVLDILAHENVEPGAIERAQDFESLISLVSVGAGIALVPQSVSAVARPGMTFRAYRGYNPGIQMTVHARFDNRAPQVLQFFDVARTFVRKLGLPQCQP